LGREAVCSEDLADPTWIDLVGHGAHATSDLDGGTGPRGTAAQRRPGADLPGPPWPPRWLIAALIES